MTMKETMNIIMHSLSDAEVYSRKEARDYLKKYHPKHLDNLNEAFRNGWIKRNRLWGYDLNKTGFREYMELTQTQRYTLFTDSDGKKTIIPQPLQKETNI